LWIARTGSPWRDLPAAFGKWNSVFTRFRSWMKAGVFQRIFDAVADDPDLEYAMVDATIVKVHRHGQGAKGGRRAKPSASRRAAGRPRSWRSPMHLAIWSALSCCQAIASRPSALRH